MKTIRKLKKRSGFTLVELLIVIIIIGILAGAMMLIAGSGSDRAEATKIISDLRSMKAAALMYYADTPNANLPDNGDNLDRLQPYMDRVISGDYVFRKGSDSDQWFVGRTNVPTGVRTPLANTAQEAALLKNTTSADFGTIKYTANDTNVFMRAR